jgi:hypothetical protein
VTTCRESYGPCYRRKRPRTADALARDPLLIVLAVTGVTPEVRRVEELPLVAASNKYLAKINRSHWEQATKMQNKQRVGRVGMEAQGRAFVVLGKPY